VCRASGVLPSIMPAAAYAVKCYYFANRFIFDMG
jgi:hypothetical protein